VGGAGSRIRRASDSDSVSEFHGSQSRSPIGAFVAKEDLFKERPPCLLAPVERGAPILLSKITGPGPACLLIALLDEGKRGRDAAGRRRARRGGLHPAG